jgi:hypothetical protein
MWKKELELLRRGRMRLKYNTATDFDFCQMKILLRVFDKYQRRFFGDARQHCVVGVDPLFTY